MFSFDMSDQWLATFNMFVHLFTELSVLFLVISFLVAILNQKIPAERIQVLLGGRNGRGYFVAAGLGAITPFCSCSSIPMLIGLLKARAGFGPVMTFLFTSPLLNPIVVALFIPVLGWKVTAVYASLALVSAVSAGYFLNKAGFERYVKKELFDVEPKKTCCNSKPAEVSVAVSYSQAWQESYTMFRSMFPYMFIAMVIGALVHGFVPAEFLGDIAGADNPYAVPAAAVIGVPLYIRVTALLPLVAPLLAKGASIGAIMALVIGAGGASLPEMILLKRLFHWPLLVAFVGVILTVAIAGGTLFNLLFT